jgi:DNA-binding NarL/FixJ family response regulator
MDLRVQVQVLAVDPVLKVGIEGALSSRREIEIVSDVQAVSPLVVVVAVDSVDEDTIRMIHDLHCHDRLHGVLVAALMDPSAALNALEAGISSLLYRVQASPERLSAAIMAAASGDGMVPPDLLLEMLKLDTREQGSRGGGENSLMLNERERTVLRLIADGYDTAEIAEMLAYSRRTVTGIVHDITSRLRLRNRAHAVAYALREGLI